MLHYCQHSSHLLLISISLQRSKDLNQPLSSIIAHLPYAHSFIAYTLTVSTNPNPCNCDYSCKWGGLIWY